MANNLGDFDPAAVIYGKFTTVNPSTGAPATLTGSATLAVYKDNSTTSSTSGVTLTVDFGGVTGSNHFTIDTSTSASFYAAGSFFDAQISAGNVGGVSAVGYFVGQFTLQRAAVLRPTTASRTLNVAAGGQASINWGDVANPTTTVALTNTTISTSTLTAGVIASAVWQDAVAGDFTVAASIGKALYINNVVPGASGGHFIAGTNAPTAVTFSGYAFQTGDAYGFLTATLSESYAAVHVTPTLAQLLYEMRAVLVENTVASVTVTTKRIDGSSGAATYTINSATTPTSITRAT